MEATTILLDKENQEIKIFFGHTNYCVSAPLTWQNYNLYCYFNNIEIDRGELVSVEYHTKLLNDTDWNKLIDF
jgi:hypothetical protein